MNQMTTFDRSAQRADWQGGWYSLATQCRSENFGPRPGGACVDLIVVHSISLPPGIFGGNNVQRFFTNRLSWDDDPYYDSIRGLKVSSHFFIDRKGGLWQFVSCDDRAWHAGISSYRGRDNCNDYSIGIELEGLEGDAFETEQYTKLSNLCLELKNRYPITGVAGHQHVAPERKNDPGIGFDWHQFQKTVGWPAQCFP